LARLALGQSACGGVNGSEAPAPEALHYGHWSGFVAFGRWADAKAGDRWRDNGGRACGLGIAQLSGQTLQLHAGEVRRYRIAMDAAGLRLHAAPPVH
jgi:hypothetical protein